MKRIFIIILALIIFTLLISSCSNRLVVNEKLSGQSDHWAITYNIKGRIYTRVNRYGNEKLICFGKRKYTVKYVGDLDDIIGLTQWSAKGNELMINFGSGRNCSPDKSPSFSASGGVTIDTLLFLHNSEIPIINISWNGDNVEEEIIELN